MRLVKSSRGFADVECFQVFAFPPEKREVCWVCAQESVDQQPSIHTEELQPAGPLRVGVETFFLKTAELVFKPEMMAPAQSCCILLM